MFGSLGGPELLLILVIALIVFGPRKLPEMGKSLGKMLVEFRRASNEFKRTIEDEVEAEKVRDHVQAASAPAVAPPVEPAPASEPEATPAVTPPLDFAHDDRSPGAPLVQTPEGTVPTGGSAGEPH